MTFSKKLFLTIAVVVALGTFGVNYLKGRSASPSANTPSSKPSAQSSIELVPSDVVIAEKYNMTQGLAISGTLKATRSAMVKARVVGELMALDIREGDAVKAGQIIAKIDPTEYLAKQRQAQQQAEAARAQVEIAQRQFDNNNALVNQGFISKTALDTSQANLNAAKANYQAALSALDVASKAER